MCDQTKYGFDCVCEWIHAHPGDIQYTCEFCGIYVAGAPRCNKCEEDECTPERVFNRLLETKRQLSVKDVLNDDELEKLEFINTILYGKPKVVLTADQQERAKKLAEDILNGKH